MTPKEKAKNLVDKFMPLVEAYSSQGQVDNAKQCALIAVDEIPGIIYANMEDNYWQQVKQEIKKL